MAEAAAEKPGSRAVWREAVQLEDFRDQEQHALRGSEVFLDREVGRVRGVRH